MIFRSVSDGLEEYPDGWMGGMLRRVTSSIAFFIILLISLLSPIPGAHYLILIIIFGATLLGTQEYYNLARRRNIRPSPWPGHAIALAFLVDAYFFGFQHFVHIFITLFWILLFTQVLFKSFDRAIANTATSLFGAIYVGLPMAILLYISKYAGMTVGVNGERVWNFTEPHAGGYVILFLVITSWATDIGGYLIGKPFGRHKITPVLSPHKSFEGVCGGSGSCRGFGSFAEIFVGACRADVQLA